VIVTIDKFSGFCWGVVRTIDIAEQELSNGEELYSLGDIIHNPVEIQRLGDQGLRTISTANLDAARGKKVLIRAHGEPPSTYKRAEELGITIVDATCPVVTKVQERIRRFYTDGFQVVIFGKKDHAEVVGLVGQTNGEAIVIKSHDEIGKIALDRKTVLFSQTTMDKAAFHRLKEELQKKVKELIVGSIEDEAVEFHAKDTICGQVSGRDKKIREYAASNDVVIFVAGRTSSNGKVLFDIAKEANPKTFFVETAAELDPAWFTGVTKVGITGATSTPQWFMERVKAEIEARFDTSSQQVEHSEHSHH
jgi:4-hydroxy-3-methylbut-2-en-1-yl diphosphate reductase